MIHTTTSNENQHNSAGRSPLRNLPSRHPPHLLEGQDRMSRRRVTELPEIKPQPSDCIQQNRFNPENPMNQVQRVMLCCNHYTLSLPKSIQVDLNLSIWGTITKLLLHLARPFLSWDKSQNMRLAQTNDWPHGDVTEPTTVKTFQGNKKRHAWNKHLRIIPDISTSCSSNNKKCKQQSTHKLFVWMWWLIQLLIRNQKRGFAWEAPEEIY